MVSKNKLVKIKQIASPKGRKSYQRKCLVGLGLNKINRVKEVEDTPSTRGMINKIKHLVEIIENGQK